MVFSKVDYWKNRKKAKRGQGLLTKPKIYQKGEKVTFIDGKGEEKEMLNASGSHMARVDGKLQRVNRRVSRNVNRSHPATKKNYQYQVESKGFKHEVKEKEVKPTNPPSLTNHMRHRQRQVMRELNKKQEEENAKKPIQKKA